MKEKLNLQDVKSATQENEMRDGKRSLLRVQPDDLARLIWMIQVELRDPQLQDIETLSCEIHKNIDEIVLNVTVVTMYHL